MAELLVTHADTWIGARLVDVLRRDDDHNVHTLKRDALHQLRRADQFTHIFHLGHEGTDHVVAYCRRKLAMLTFASDWMYGDQTANQRAEDAIKEYSEAVDWPAFILRRANLYGPGQPADETIPSIVRQVKAKTPIIVGHLSTAKDWLYVDDFIHAVACTMRPSEGCPTYDVAAGKETTIAEIVAAAQRAAGTDLPIMPTGHREPSSDYTPDLFTVRAKLGWRPTTSLDRGLRTMLTAAEPAPPLGAIM